MNPTSPELFLLFFLVGNFMKNSFARIDVEKEYREHSNCNGERISLPLEWMPQALLASTQCSYLENENCEKQCIVFVYPNVMKNGRPDMVWLRKESKKMTLSKRNERAREELLDGIEKCDKPLPRLAKPNGDESCPDAKKFEKCMEEEFKYACRGKTRPKDNSTAFLDEINR